MVKRIVCLCGKNIGFMVARFLLNQSIETRFVINKNEKVGEWYDSPKTLKVKVINESDIIEFNPDLIIVAFYDKILTEEIFSFPKYGSWNLHLGDAEIYRGAYPNIFALKNGDTTYAVTLHRINEGIDTGDILQKNSFSISPSMTGKELYYKMTINGFNLFKRNFSDLISGKALNKTRKQNNSKARTNYRDKLNHEVHPTSDLIDSVRALTFTPFPPPFFRVGKKKFIIIEEPQE